MRHGTVSAYTNHACRCLDCKRANYAGHRARYELLRSQGLCVRCKQTAGAFAMCPACRAKNIVYHRAYKKRAA